MNRDNEFREAGGSYEIPREEVLPATRVAASVPTQPGAALDRLDLAQPSAAQDIRVGDIVSPADHDNIGEVREINDSKARVFFVNKKDGGSAEAWFPLAALRLVKRKAPVRQLEILSFQRLMKLRPPGWLVQPIVRKRELCILYGPSECGKTFVVLSLALSIAAGVPWYGHPVQQGPVLYIAAEGVFGLPSRIGAWLIDKDGAGPILDANFFALGRSAKFLEAEQFQQLLEKVAALPVVPVLIVVDTLARCMAGFDENSAKDMGLFVEACDELRDRTAATVLVVHHSGKPSGQGKPIERGSSALRGAADTVIAVTRDGHKITLDCSKMKEAGKFDDLEFDLQTVTVAIRADEPFETSCRLVRMGADGAETGDMESHASLTVSHHAILTELSRPLFIDGESRSTLLKALELADATFYRCVNQLIERGYIEQFKVGGYYKLRLTPKGRSTQVSPLSPSLKPILKADSHTLTVPPPFRGGERSETECETRPESDKKPGPAALFESTDSTATTEDPDLDPQQRIKARRKRASKKSSPKSQPASIVPANVVGVAEGRADVEVRVPRDEPSASGGLSEVASNAVSQVNGGSPLASTIAASEVESAPAAPAPAPAALRAHDPDADRASATPQIPATEVRNA